VVGETGGPVGLCHDVEVVPAARAAAEAHPEQLVLRPIQRRAAPLHSHQIVALARQGIFGRVPVADERRAVVLQAKLPPARVACKEGDVAAGTDERLDGVAHP